MVGLGVSAKVGLWGQEGLYVCRQEHGVEVEGGSSLSLRTSKDFGHAAICPDLSQKRKIRSNQELK
jgi:hypothetical protein